MKVAVQLSITVIEEGIIPSGEEIVAIAGTGWNGYDKVGGADTAVIIQTSTAEAFWNYQALAEHKKSGRKIREIICMPR